MVFFPFLITYLSERVTERRKQKDLLFLSPDGNSQDWATLKPKAKPSQSPTWITWAQAFGPSSTASARLLAESGVVSRATNTAIGIHMGF